MEQAAGVAHAALDCSVDVVSDPSTASTSVLAQPLLQRVVGSLSDEVAKDAPRQVQQGGKLRGIDSSSEEEERVPPPVCAENAPRRPQVGGKLRGIDTSSEEEGTVPPQGAAGRIKLRGIDSTSDEDTVAAPQGRSRRVRFLDLDAGSDDGGAWRSQ